MHPQSGGYKLLIHQYRLLAHRMRARLGGARWEVPRRRAGDAGDAGDGVRVELLQPRFLASATPYGGAFLVNQSSGATVRTPAVAEQAGGGGFVAVWAEGGGSLDAGGYGIYGRLYQADGTALGSPFLVNQTTAGDQTLPSVAINSAGSFVVTWVSGTSVYARMFGPGGANPSPEHVVATGLLGASTPGVGISSAGAAVLVYEGSGAGDTDGVYAQGLAADGSASGSAALVNTNTSGPQTAPAVAMDGNGDYAVAWVSGTNIEARLMPAAGGAAAEGTASTSSGYTVEQPAVGIDSSGDFQVAWSQLDSSGNFGVWERRYDAAQSALDTGPVQVSPNTGTSHVEPAVSADSAGDFAVAWSASAPDGSGDYGTDLTTYTPAGGSNGQVSVTSQTNNGGGSAPAVAFTSAANGVVVWYNDNTVSAGGVYAQVYGTFSANQAPTVSAPGAQTASENGSLTFSAGNGNAVSVADADSGGNAEQLTLGAAHGTLTLSGATGLTFTSGVNASGAMTVTGTLADLDAALAGLVYTPTTGYYGTDSVSVAVNDQGNTGGVAKTAAASVPVTVYAPAPTVATAASASPSPVTGTTTNLSVLGADANGESTLTYTWATTGTPPAPVTFSANGTNAAKNTTATFTAAGTYSFQVTIADPGGGSVTSTTTVDRRPDGQRRSWCRRPRHP